MPEATTTTQQQPPYGTFEGYLRGIFFLTALISVTIPYVVISVMSLFVLFIADSKFILPTENLQKQFRVIFHNINSFVGCNWNYCVGRLLVYCFNMKFRARAVIPSATSTSATSSSSGEENEKDDENRKSLEELQSILQVREALSCPAGSNKVNVIIMNHRTVLDWLFLWGAIAECEGASGNNGLKIVPKASLSKLPFVGWTMQCFRFLFLSRTSTETDLSMIEAAARSYVNEPSSISGLLGTTVLIFCEGTDYKHLARSQEYCRKNNLPIWNQVLAPKTTGLVTFLRAIGKENLGEIVDITIAYDDFVFGTVSAEKSPLNGKMPKCMHLAIRRFRPKTKQQQQNSSSASSTSTGKYFTLPDELFDDVDDVNPNEKETKTETTTETETKQQQLSVPQKFVRQLFHLREYTLEYFYERAKKKASVSSSILQQQQAQQHAHRNSVTKNILLTPPPFSVDIDCPPKFQTSSTTNQFNIPVSWNSKTGLLVGGDEQLSGLSEENSSRSNNNNNKKNEENALLLKEKWLPAFDLQITSFSSIVWNIWIPFLWPCLTIYLCFNQSFIVPGGGFGLLILSIIIPFLIFRHLVFKKPIHEYLFKKYLKNSNDNKKEN